MQMSWVVTGAMKALSGACGARAWVGNVSFQCFALSANGQELAKDGD